MCISLYAGAATTPLHLLTPLSPLGLYNQIDEATKADEAFLKLVHKLVLDVHVLEGALICPETGRRFPITAGIPNMLLHEDEVA